MLLPFLTYLPIKLYGSWKGDASSRAAHNTMVSPVLCVHALLVKGPWSETLTLCDRVFPHWLSVLFPLNELGYDPFAARCDPGAGRR